MSTATSSSTPGSQIDQLESSYPPATHDLHDPLRDASDRESEISRERFATALLPPDEGYAWVFLAAAFTVETLCWGYGFSVGVFHAYWSTKLFPEPEDANILTTASTLLTGLMYLSAVAFGPLLSHWPEKRRFLQFLGLFTSVTGIIASAFATRPWHLIVTAGILYPLGGGLAYNPAATLLFEWFARKRGIASGIMYAGTGAGGAILPFLIQALLTRFSYETAVISLGLGYAIIGAIAVYFIRERIPVPGKRRIRTSANLARRRLPTSFVYKNTFWCFVATILFTSFGNFLPSIYLPSYARELGLSDDQGTLLVSMMNASSVAGLLILGYLSDHWPIRLVLTISCIGSALSCLLLWGFATNLSVLIIFSLAFGFFALGFAAVWTRLISIVAKDDPLQPPILFSIFAFSKGIGNICSGPISNALLTKGRLQDAHFGYGVGSYGGLLLYTGGVILVGCLTGVSFKDKTD